MLRFTARVMLFLFTICLVAILAALGIGRMRPTHIVTLALSDGGAVDFALLDADHNSTVILPRPDFLLYYARSVELSPNGRRALVTVTVTYPPTGETNAYLYDLETRQTFSIPHTVGALQLWSPDSRRVAFFNDHNDLYSADIETQTTLQLTDHETMPPVSRPEWSPDSRSVAFMTGDTLYIAGVETGALRTLTEEEGEVMSFAWSPDGSCMAYHRRNTTPGEPDTFALHIVDVAGLNRCDIVYDLQYRDGYLPQWSPDGRWIAFLSNQDGQEDAFAFHLETETLYRLTQFPSYTGVPWLAWSPDSARLLLEIADGNQSAVYLVDPTGSERRLLANISRTPRWSPQGAYIFYGIPAEIGIPMQTSFYLVRAQSQATPIHIFAGNVARWDWAEDESMLAFTYTGQGQALFWGLFRPGAADAVAVSSRGVFDFAYWR